VEVVTVQGGRSFARLAEPGSRLHGEPPRPLQGARLVQRALAQRTEARGRELVERFLQREGRTAIKLEDSPRSWGSSRPRTCSSSVGKDEFSLRNIEAAAAPHAPPGPSEDEVLLARKSRPTTGEGAQGRRAGGRASIR
jgi:hypothetical protein